MTQQFYFKLYLQKKWKHTEVCIQTFVGVLFVIAQKWKQSKCPLTDEWVSKMWYTLTMEYCQAIKSDVVIHTIA